MNEEKPRQLQSRWTKALTARAMAALTRTPADMDALKSVFGEVAIDGQTYIDCRGFAPTSAVAGLRLEHVDFSHSPFSYSPLLRARLDGCRLVGVKCTEHVLSGEYLGCDFTGANLRKTTSSTPFRVEGGNFTRADFSGCEIDLAQFHECRFEETVFKRSYLTLCKFSKCTFLNPVLSDTHTAGCTFIEPTQNMKWYDQKKKAEMTHIVRQDAPWLDWHAAGMSDVRIK
jgi:hypothetical protein